MTDRLTRILVVAGGAALLAVACSNDEGTLTTSSQMPTLENVTGLVRSFTDTTGAETTRFVEDETNTSYVENTISLDSGATWVIRLWAVDDLGFFGPRSAADTLMVP